MNLPTLSTLLAVAEIALPALVLVAIAGTAAVTWLATGTLARHRGRVNQRQGRSLVALEAQLSKAEADLSAERELVARLTGPAAALLADVRGGDH